MKIRTSLLKSTLADCFNIYKNTYAFRLVIPLMGIYLMRKIQRKKRVIYNSKNTK